MLDARLIDNAIEDISEIINLAPLGLADWQDIPRAIADLFPGSLSILQNFDQLSDELTFMESVNLDTSLLQSYIDYYHTINPYEPYWKGHKDGQVWVSDHVLPATQLTNDEFYMDWMSKWGDFDSAVGCRIVPIPENEVRFNIHYPTSCLEHYEPLAQRLLNGLRAPLNRAVTLSRHIDERQISVASSSALLDRNDKAACILDMSGQVKDANCAFEDLLRSEHLLQQVQGSLQLKDLHYRDAFAKSLRKTALLAGSQTPRLIVRDDLASWVLSFSRLPLELTNGLLAHSPLVLMLVTRFGQAHEPHNLFEFSQSFGLTGAEERLCKALSGSGNLSDAAVLCGISYETARSRIKDIFLKTQTSKQADLLLMLEQYRTG